MKDSPPPAKRLRRADAEFWKMVELLKAQRGGWPTSPQVVLHFNPAGMRGCGTELPYKAGTERWATPREMGEILEEVARKEPKFARGFNAGGDCAKKNFPFTHKKARVLLRELGFELRQRRGEEGGDQCCEIATFFNGMLHQGPTKNTAGATRLSYFAFGGEHDGRRIRQFQGLLAGALRERKPVVTFDDDRLVKAGFDAGDRLSQGSTHAAFFLRHFRLYLAVRRDLGDDFALEMLGNFERARDEGTWKGAFEEASRGRLLLVVRAFVRGFFPEASFATLEELYANKAWRECGVTNYQGQVAHFFPKSCGMGMWTALPVHRDCLPAAFRLHATESEFGHLGALVCGGCGVGPHVDGWNHDMERALLEGAGP